VSFDYRGRCALCGTRLRGIWSTVARINRRSLRTTGGILFVDRRCYECGFETNSRESQWALSVESLAAIAAYRERKWAS